MGKSGLTLVTFIISNITVCQAVHLKLTLKFKSLCTLLALKVVDSFVDRAACLKVLLVITFRLPHT